MERSNSRISRIDTLWSVVRRAHDSQETTALNAQQQLLDIYGNAIKRYLLAALRNQEQADDLFQEFALKFIQGGFQNVDESKGRFRAFVKTVLYRMVALHHRKKAVRKEQAFPSDPETRLDPSFDEAAEDERFHADWRDEILDQAWQALVNHEQESDANYFTVLNTRVNEPELTSEGFAERLSDLLGRPIKSGAARVSLHRAREKFAGFIIQAVAQSLEQPTRHNIEEELIDLQLIEYCRDGLDSIDD